MGACLLAIGGCVVGGCGLALDLDPPDLQGADASARDGGRELDGGFDAAIDPDRDGGTSDGGTSDASVRADAAVDASRDGGSDAGHADAGTGIACRTSSDCVPLIEHCSRPRGSCFGEGVCRLRATACVGVVAEPVCGCDWEQYSSPCEASRRGTSVMQGGVCPMAILAGEWCALRPMADAVGGCARCFDDADCGAFFPICVASACAVGGEGLCAGDPGLSGCHDGRQCDGGEICLGSVSDVCIPMDGRCGPRPP
ncbi:MAG: hypothetical protein M3Y87_09490 [Myxococcota bacterium]|nr:hypothetical protein [Myxococcota bacterium]